MIDHVESRVVISGIGNSEMGRRLHRDPWQLTADAALAAIADAGLSVADIDGVSTYPGACWSSPGLTGAGADDLRDLLGLGLRWHSGGGETAGQLGSVVNAVLAVGAGIAEHVVCFRSVWESTAQEQYGSRAATLTGRASSDDRARFANESAQWNLPYGIAHACFGGLAMSRYLHESGATRAQIGQLAVVQRQHAAANPAAVYREPLTLDDYLDARMISEPLCIYDCDVPMDGSVAVVISRRGNAATERSHAITIEAMGSASGMCESAEMMWSRTNLRADDVDVGEIYDGFSIYAIEWLEALGLCPRYGAGAFLEGGHRISLDGDLPLNTGGGQLSAGRMHGYGALLEACLQLREEGSTRQVTPTPEVAVVTSGAGSFTSCLLLGAPESP